MALLDNSHPLRPLLVRHVLDQRLDEVVDDEVRMESRHLLAAVWTGQVAVGCAVLPHLHAVLTKFVAALAEHHGLQRQILKSFDFLRLERVSTTDEANQEQKPRPKKVFFWDKNHPLKRKVDTFNLPSKLQQSSRQSQ